MMGRLYRVLTNNDNDTEAEVEETFTYDKYGNILTSTEKAVDFSGDSFTTSYQYDFLNRMTKITYPTTPTFEVTYTYNQQGNLSSIGTTSDVAYYATYDYNAEGAMTQEVLNNNNSTYKKICQFTYNTDPRGRLTAINNDLFKEFITYTSKSFDGLNTGYYNGCIASDSFYYATGGPSAYMTKFRYDNFGRMVIADNIPNDTYDLGISASGSANPITYDANGNLWMVDRHGSVKNYIYYQGANSRTNKLRNTNGTSENQYAYDLNANLINSSPKSLTISYDPFTQMTMRIATAPNHAYKYQYNGNKERILEIDSSASITKTLYLRGTNDFPIMEKVSNGTVRYYIYGPKGLITKVENGSYYYHFTDHLGSTRGVMNGSNGNGLAWFAYDAWGSLIQAIINVETSYRFMGQEYDDGINLYNFRARFYDDNIGRFYAMDPAEQGFGPYSFAGNNPIIYIDKDGKWFIIDDFILGFIRGLIRGEPPFKTGFKLASNMTKVWSTMFRGNFWQIVTKWTWELPN